MQSTGNRRQEFMRHYGPVRESLARYARAICSDLEEARDLVAETTLRAWEGFDTLRDPDAFLSWIFTIATRTHRRRGVREKYHAPWSDDLQHTLPSSDTRPDVSAEVRLLYDALSRLPGEQAEAVILFEIADLPLKEIARIQGVTLSGVKSRVTRGREALGRLLGVAWETDREEERGRQEPGGLLYINAA